MLRQLKIEKSIYLIDDEDKSYRFLRRNLSWRRLAKKQNILNKQLLDGYTRIFNNDTTKRYVFKQGG